jgi:hypothetical protein
LLFIFTSLYTAFYLGSVLRSSVFHVFWRGQRAQKNPAEPGLPSFLRTLAKLPSDLGPQKTPTCPATLGVGLISRACFARFPAGFHAGLMRLGQSCHDVAIQSQQERTGLFPERWQAHWFAGSLGGWLAGKLPFVFCQRWCPGDRVTFGEGTDVSEGVSAIHER